MSAARLARPVDRDYFLCLWHDYLTEMAAKGSEILPTPRTLAFYADLFDAYTSGTKLGIAAVAYPAAVSMAGDATPGYDSTQGRTAIGWGTYVVPELRDRGHAAEIRNFVIAELARRGFQTLLGTVQVGDNDALSSIRKVPGVEVVQHVYRRTLSGAKEPA